MGLLFLFVFGSCAVVLWLTSYMMGFGPMPMHDRPDPFIWRSGPWAGGLWLLILLGIVGVFLTVRNLRRTTAPIWDVMDAAERVADGDYEVRVAEQGPRETRELARTFNSMTERLQSNETQRRALLADVTHELRTPLTVMQGNLEALLDGVYPHDDEHLAPILEETRVLARLVEDLRTLSLAESGALKLHKEPTDLEILIEETAAAFRTQADTDGVQLLVNTPGDLPPLELDPVRIREVIANLITNALRHTPAGGLIEITATQAQSQIQLTVRDTGSGIAPDDLPHIFDRFYKSEQSRGTGLGLAIARNLVAAHGGEITVQSQLGGGTTFRITLKTSEVS
jgi:signal transduction histidine kinase